MAYGYTIEPHKPDPLVDLGDKAMYGFSDAGTFGAYLVDILPFCTSRQSGPCQHMLHLE